jgi:sucrose phosphorylase
VPVKNQVQLITYPDSMGGNLKTLNHLLLKHFADVFKGGVHILPPFPSSGDRGFAPLTYLEIAPEFGTWDDIRRIGDTFDVTIDVMVNHISRQSAYFQDFVKRGRKSGYADLFITTDKIWPDGDPPAEDLARIMLRKPDHPFSTVVIAETGQTEQIWTTFGTRNWSEQIDLDVRSEQTRELLTSFLRHFSQQNIAMVRLDAVGYVIKKPGTTCFMVEPEIYDFLDWVVQTGNQMGLEMLPEVHAHYTTQFKLAERGYWVYDFVLPLLVLFTLLNGTGQKLRDYLKTCPRKQITTLDSHDGIPVQPDLDDILTVEEAQGVVEICLQRGANLTRVLSGHKQAEDFDAHQINCTYYAALDCDDDAYLAARAIQFFSPGVPQVYYVGLLAGENDYQEMERVGEGRAINRHNYTVDEVEQALDKEVIRRLMQLIRFRNEHPAFDGQFQVLDSPDDEIIVVWQNGHAMCRLQVDLNTSQTVIAHTDESGEILEYPV